MSTQLKTPEVRKMNVPGPGRRRGFRGWRIPVVCALVTGVIGFAVSHVVTHWYRTDVTLYFPAQGNTDASSLISSVIGKKPTDTNSVSLLGGLLSSPEVASGPQTAIAVLDSDRCKNAVADQCGLEAKWRLSHVAVINRLSEKVSYGVDKNGLLSIEVDDPNPALAVQIAQSYVDNLQSISQNLSAGAAHANRVFVEKEFAQERSKLTALETKLASMQSNAAHPDVMLATSSRLGEVLMDLESRKTQARIALDTTDSELKWVNRTASTTLKNGSDLPLDVPLAQGMRERLRSLEAQYAYAQETLGPENPQYKSLKIQIDQLRAQLSDEIQREARGLKEGITPDVAQLYARRAGLQAEYDGLQHATEMAKTTLRQLPSSEMRQAQLEQDIKVEEEVTGMLAGEVERARIVEQRDMATFVIVDHPSLPERPYYPNPIFATILSLVAGLLIGSAWLVAGGILQMQPATAPTSINGE